MTRRQPSGLRRPPTALAPRVARPAHEKPRRRSPPCAPCCPMRRSPAGRRCCTTGPLLRPSSVPVTGSPRPRRTPVDRFEPNLRIPGPTSLPPSVRAAGARQMINHRGPEFAAMLARITNGMRPYFGTTRDIVVLSCAASGRVDAAVVNVLSPGDRVLGVSIGSFGDRFAKIASTYGADVTKLDVDWGHAAEPAALRQQLATGAYRPGLLAHNETSTGVMNPIPELAAVIRDVQPDALILVDSVSALGAVPFAMDESGVDVVVTGSQTAWMAAPGLAMIAASERAWKPTETTVMPRFYLDLRTHRHARA